MDRVAMVSYARTPIGKYLGGLKTVPVQDLATLTIKEAIARAGIQPEAVEEVILGHVISTPAAGNIGRMAALKAGLGYKCTGYTVNRICASGLQAIVCGANQIRLGQNDVIVAGGAESLSRVPYYLPLECRYKGLRGGNYTLYCSNAEYARHASPEDTMYVDSMGETAENIAEMMQIPREDQDLFAYESHMKAWNATKNGRFAREIVPVSVVDGKNRFSVSVDEHIRPDTTPDALARLKPCFKENGSVTAGNSSGQNDAAAAVVLMREATAKRFGIKPLAYIGQSSLGGVDPRIMGMGPVPAILSLLEKTGYALDSIDVLEINEAFAVQVLGCMKKLGSYIGSPLYSRLNPNGGAVALGHPLGMSGTRLAGTLALELNDRGGKRGIASACIGGGQGLAVMIERD